MLTIAFRKCVFVHMLCNRAVLVQAICLLQAGTASVKAATASVQRGPQPALIPPNQTHPTAGKRQETDLGSSQLSSNS